MLVISKVVPPDARAAEMAWQREGLKIADEIFGPGSVSWLHFPATVACATCPSRDADTTSVVFRNRQDLDRWMASEERLAWLEHAPEATQREKIWSVDLGTDYLSQWMVSSEAGGSAAPPSAPPAWWKVAVNIVVAMYPLAILNAAMLLPFVAASLPGFARLPTAVRMFVPMCWTTPLAVRLVMPWTKQGLTAAGLFSEKLLGVGRGLAAAASCLGAAMAVGIRCLR